MCCPFTLCTADDVPHLLLKILLATRTSDKIIYGKTQEEHDKTLRDVVTKLREKNITLNKNKCQFNKDSLEFYRYIFSGEGISADPKPHLLPVLCISYAQKNNRMLCI
jgi:hypothetical protein